MQSEEMKHSATGALLVPAVIIIAFASGCGTVASIWPMAGGRSSVSISAGGPFANVGGVQLPIPYVVARYRYGITDQLGLYAGTHPLIAGFGTAGLEGGLTWHFIKQKGFVPCIGVGAGAIGFYEFDGGGGRSLLPTAEITAAYMGKRSVAYAGVHTMCQLSPSFYMTYTPYVGQEYRLTRRLSVNVETRWYAAYEDNQPRAITFPLTIANHGALGLVGGINCLIGGWYVE
ncbi:MAG: hypothetical protein JSU73_03625 [candidate division WOR-3 bacterium]|nr:MAG: hypothetical protein JSU73_03625 [candidate division WOR-3 bacterium]